MEQAYHLLQGDCLELMKGIPDGSVDMILCDLPYGNTRNSWDVNIEVKALWEQYKRIIKTNGAILLFGSGKFTAELMHSNPKDWRYNLIWEKTTPTGFLNAKRMPLRCHEDILVFYRKPPLYNPIMTKSVRKVSTVVHRRNSKTGDSYGKYKPISYDSDTRYPRSVLHFATDKQKSALHPTQKPIALLEYLIRLYTDKNDIVLDNCMGSGSTGVACMRTGRKFIGIELDEKYFQIAQDRISKEERIENKWTSD